MNLGEIPLFHMIRRSLDYQAQRQTVIAENIANADTPGYQARDLQSFEAVLADSGFGRLAPMQTHASHVAPRTSTPDARDADELYEVAPSGNQVSLEQQLIALNEVSANHQLSLRLMDRHLGMLRTALGRGA